MQEFPTTIERSAGRDSLDCLVGAAGQSLPRCKRYNLRHPDRRKATAKKYREANRAKRNAYKREWAKRNAEHVRQYQSAWIEKQQPNFWQRWPSRPPQKSRKPGRNSAQAIEANKILRQKMRATISDSYLRGWMSRTTGYTIKPSEWPADLVELKRAQLKVTRLCRKSRTTTN
jgi:hypothetical protein